jgi:hypothetical protein
VTPDEIAHRCGIMVLSSIACGAYLVGFPGVVPDAIRADWQYRTGIASTAMQLATIAAGRAKPPPLGIEDTRARDWLDGLCD